jgi:hypothetical protein
MDPIGHVRLDGDGTDVGNGRGEDNVTSTSLSLHARRMGYACIPSWS